MGSLSTGGGTSAVAASAHAGCERFRLTDPLIIGRSRRALAEAIGYPDTSARIPKARWIRAMTFEHLVHDRQFVSELLTKTVGQLGLGRPVGVRRRDCEVSIERTFDELAAAHGATTTSGEATMLVELALPFPGMETEAGATPVKPDFAIVCPRIEGRAVVGSWLIMGDAKDYERVRSRIDDGRMLKGFLQVALGAEAAAQWSKLPAGLLVHDWGALAVPRNAFLRPEAVVERLNDHRAEVGARAAERTEAMRRIGAGVPTDGTIEEWVAHLRATYDPQTCTTCSLHSYCRAALRTDADPLSLLVEIGVEKPLRPAVSGLVDGSGARETAPGAVVHQIEATLSGRAYWTHRRRTDPVGEPGTVNVVLAKSDAAALGVYGIATQTIRAEGVSPWSREVFADPQALQTRLAIMRRLGEAIQAHLGSGAVSVHLVVPDPPTADLLVSIADSLAGVELSRLRWQRDLDQGRPALTFDGEPARLPEPLDNVARVAVSFLLEEDRARAFSLRCPVVDLRAVLASHVIAGGPAVDSGRLDYLVVWAEAAHSIDHRAVSDDIAAELHTPGARPSNAESDAIHEARQMAASRYVHLVSEALEYKADVVDRAVAALERVAPSKLRTVYRVLEEDAQEIWVRRLALHASDLVRFSRTSRRWRNDQVEMLGRDEECRMQLSAIADPQQAWDVALDAGVRHLATAKVIGVDPIRLDVSSRRLVAGKSVGLLHRNDQPAVEEPATGLKIQGTSFKFSHLAIGRLAETPGEAGLIWTPREAPALAVGDRLVIADQEWFGKPLTSGHEINVSRPKRDTNSAPGKDCTADSYALDPEAHHWCCRPHEAAEADTSDYFAEQRAQGAMNPQVWPPLVDEDRFDVGTPADIEVVEPGSVPTDLTLDDLGDEAR